MLVCCCSNIRGVVDKFSILNGTARERRMTTLIDCRRFLSTSIVTIRAFPDSLFLNLSATSLWQRVKLIRPIEKISFIRHGSEDLGNNRKI